MLQLKGFAWALFQSFWAAVLALLLVPLYLRYVGIEGYGLIGVFTSLQAIVLVLDLGLTPAISRETARLIEANEPQELRITIQTLEIITGVLAVTVGVCLALASSTIASSWLQAKTITMNQLEDALLLMALAIAIKWPIGFYHGILIGSHRLVLSSKLQLFFTTLAGVGSIAVFIVVSPSVIAFLIWHCCVTALHLICLRLQIARFFVGTSTTAFSLATLRRVLPFSLQMGAVAATGLVFTQMDRVLLSRMLPLEAFAAYSVAVLLASGLHIVVGPVFNSIYPKFVAYVQNNSHQIAVEQYSLASSLLLAVLVPVASFVALNAQFLLEVWTANSVVSANAAPVLGLLVIGYAINGVMYPAYALQLAYGQAKIPLYINLGLSVVSAPLLYVLITEFGIWGGGVSWLGVSIIYLFVGTWVTWRFLRLPVEWSALFVRWIFPAVCMLLLTYALSNALTPAIGLGYRLALTTCFSVTCGLVYLLVFRSTRWLLLNSVNRTWICITSTSKKEF